MALAWESELDDQDDDVAWFAALAAGYDLPTLAERLAAAQPEWMASARCRGSSVDFFDPGRAAAARELCGDCSVAESCRASPTGRLGGLTKPEQD